MLFNKISSIFLIALFIFGCGKKVDIVQLGATFPLTGNVASYGIKAKNGIQLRIDEINAIGGINGKKLEVNFQDDKNSIKDAVNIFTSFVTINRYPLVFGSAGSSVTLALTPLANHYKTLLISPVSSSSELSTKGGNYFFRTVPSDNLQAEMLSNWVINDGIKKVAIIYTNNNWGKPLADSFSDLFLKAGGEIVFSDGIQENSGDFRTIILKIRNLKFDAIISPTYPKEGGLFVRQLKEAGISTKLYGGDNWGAPEFVSIAQNAANGVYFTFPSENKSKLFEEFTVKYEKIFKTQPDIIAAYGYDAATAVINAIQKTKDLTGEEIRNALLTVTFEGVSGKIAFKTNGDLISNGYGKREIKNGQSISLN